MGFRSTFVAALTLWLAQLPSAAKGGPINWGGNFTPCQHHSELLKRNSMSLGVKISTANAELARQFENALDFWATIVEMDWHEDETSSCAIQLVEGTPAILKGPVVARSQFAEWDNFQGWIAFDPHAECTKTEMYAIAVHEIGHMLGLKHNQSPHSVMYFLNLDGQEVVDRSDLKQLSLHHKLKVGPVDTPLQVAQSQSGD